MENLLLTKIEKLEAEDRKKTRCINMLQKRCSKLEKFYRKRLTVPVAKRRNRNFFTVGNANISMQTNTDIHVEEEMPVLDENEYIHDRVLRENLPLMVSDMEIRGTYLLDELIEDSCLSSDEGADIRQLDDRKDQTRKLASILSKRSARSFSYFIKRMAGENNYPHIADALQMSYIRNKSLLGSQQKQKKDCFICAVKGSVKIKDIVDTLVQQDIVDWDFLCQLESRDNSEAEWDFVFECIDSMNDRSAKLKNIGIALEKKHKEIKSLIDKGLPQRLKCNCIEVIEPERHESSLPSYSDAKSSISPEPNEEGDSIESMSTIDTSESCEDREVIKERFHLSPRVHNATEKRIQTWIKTSASKYPGNGLPKGLKYNYMEVWHQGLGYYSPSPEPIEEPDNTDNMCTSDASELYQDTGEYKEQLQHEYSKHRIQSWINSYFEHELGIAAVSRPVHSTCFPTKFNYILPAKKKRVLCPVNSC